MSVKVNFSVEKIAEERRRSARGVESLHQNCVLYIFLFIETGSKIRISIQRTNATTPPSLFGIDLRIA